MYFFLGGATYYHASSVALLCDGIIVARSHK